MGDIPAGIRNILERLAGRGHQAVLVGGCVRDLLMGRTPQDWDIASSARPEAVMDLFGENARPTGLRHGTVTVLEAGERAEVTTFRRDGNYLDCRHPDHVEFTGSLEEDLARRDFTVNAMAMTADGEILDPFGGREDLSRELLRCVGEPERRLTEDALRILRCLRFASVLSFAIDGGTEEALRRCAPLLRRIAAERVREELMKLICGRAAAEVLLAYPDVVGVVLPEILPAVGFAQRNRHHCYDVWEHSVRAMAAAPPDRVVRLTLLLHDLGKPETFSLGEDGVGHFYGHGKRSAAIAETVCARLRLDRAERETVCRLVALHDVQVPPTEKGVRRMLRRLGEEDFRRLLQVKRGDNLAQHPAYRERQQGIDQLESLLDQVLREDQCFSLRQLAVNGRDLLALGLRGRAVGQALERLLDLVIEGKLPNDRERLLREIKEEREQ